MEAYGHLVVVMSIVMGLALTQLLRGAAQLYRLRARRSTYWLHSAWVGLLVLLSLVLWWTYWNYRDITDWNFLRYVLYLAPTIIFYYLTAIAIPDPDEGVTNLEHYYFENRGAFFGTLMTYAVMAGVTAVVVRRLPVLDPSAALRLAMIALLPFAIASRRAVVHAVVLAASAVLLVLYIALFHYRLA